jgi:hypothetical protein
MPNFTPHSSIVPFFADAAEPGIPEFDANRIMAYAQYEQFYWNHPESFRLVQRGEDEAPIYLPSARRIIEATNRFLAVGFDYAIDSAVGTPDSRAQLDLAFKALFKRELFHVKFNAQRRWGLVRGDAIWHITADDTKPEGTRISLHDVHPKRYFPIVDADDPTRVVGCHLVETIADPRDKTKQVIRRQTYRKELDAVGLPTGLITTELSLWEVGKWDDRYLEPKDLKMVALLRPVTPLPPAITSLPVYHIRNTWDEYAFRLVYPARNRDDPGRREPGCERSGARHGDERAGLLLDRRSPARGRERRADRLGVWPATYDRGAPGLDGRAAGRCGFGRAVY